MTSGRLVVIEPVEQQDEAGRERKLQEIDPSGQLIYKQYVAECLHVLTSAKT